MSLIRAFSHHQLATEEIPMPTHPRTHAQQLDDLQSILREDYGQNYELVEVAEIADWLGRFYTALIKLAVQRRVAEHEAAKGDIS
ncbi:hypothetical protein OG948_13400 [Embleya sp. NBC_00888]|uniref:hypothetical protein n=1 Tax=Embleya sp. NBC_00888 TaxID=2975960 RepID=UPI003864D592|nr:hypothetical protein OG948_13400 [Embleya sp. NBC_00888]